MIQRGSPLKHLIQTAVSVIYPSRCVGCGSLVEDDFGLCASCWRDTPLISGTVCNACGSPQPGLQGGGRIECDDCLRTPRPWVEGRAAIMYQDRGRQIVLRFKHGDRTDIAIPAAKWMIRAARPFLNHVDIIAPVPLHPFRLLRRRYNQAALLAQAISAQAARPVCVDLLQRHKHTQSQDGKTLAERFANTNAAISLHPRRRHRIMRRSVLLVDDVMTSGATFTACADACLEAGAQEVYVLALARVAKDT